MEIIRHPGFLEIKLPDFFSLDPRTDNLARTLTAVQPGTGKLLLDITHRAPGRLRIDDAAVRHTARMLADALNAMTDNAEMIAFLASASSQEAVTPYLKQLETYGFRVRLFDQKNRAIAWLGSGYPG
jgi:hypothetical protein